MDIINPALREAARALQHDLGPLEDLRPDLRNTLANIYYKFHLVAVDPGNTATALNWLSKDTLSMYKEMGDVLGDYKVAADLVRSMRRARNQAAWLFDFLQTVTLDLLKYRIPNAQAKSAIRRAIERPFRRVDEITGLYEKMLVGK